MDKRKSILNVSVSIGFKLITMVMVIVVKRYLIRFCGNEVNGLNALYLSVVGFLAVAELGVGSAITFCMYKPIVEGDHDQVSALYQLFRRLYLIIGGIILVSGLAITPFIPYFAKDYAQLDVNLYTTFVIMLISVVVTYFFGAQTALINAYKNNYITTAITSAGIVLQYILQIIVLIITKSFTWYLICRIAAALVQWLVTELVARKRYTPIIKNKQKLAPDIRKELLKNIKAMFMHKIGTLLVTTADNVIISTFVGVVALGEYSNYSTIMASVTGVLKLVFSSLTSVFGHLYVEKTRETTMKYCEMFHLLNFLIGVLFYLGYYAIIDHLIAILFSADLLVAKSVSFVIALNGFVHFMRQSGLSFREATGTFYNDRWKPLLEGIVNIVLSIAFVKWIGMAGVIAATVLTDLFVCHIVEPYVLFKHAFLSSPKKYYLRNYSMILFFTIALVILDHCLQDSGSHWESLLVNGFISVGVSAVVCFVVLVINKDLRKHLMYSFKRR